MVFPTVFSLILTKFLEVVFYDHVYPMEKKCKKAKWLSGEALETAVKRREAKSNGEKEKYKHLNAEF